MSAASGHGPIELKKFELSFPLWIFFIVSIVLGAVSLYLIALEDSHRAWINVLIGSMIFLGLGLCGLFFVMVNNIVRAKWMISMRRVYEAMALTLPVAAVLIFIVFLGRHHIYEWTDPAVVAADPLIRMKSVYLNENFLAWRLVAAFAVYLFATWYLIRNSFRQDHDGDLKHSVKNYKASAILMVFFALVTTMVSFDLLLSIEPHWFSTIYGVYYFAAFFQAGLAASYLVCWLLWRKGVFAQSMNKAHFHELGKFVFAFSVFWAYIVFSQFMLYWYGDLAEETFWYKVRSENGWESLAVLVPIVRWVIPFFILLPYGNKTRFPVILPVCVLILAGHWLDLFWNAMPAARLFAHGVENYWAEAPFGAGFAWQEILVGMAFFSLFFVCLGLIMQRIRMIPIRDPQLEKSLHHHE